MRADGAFVGSDLGPDERFRDALPTKSVFKTPQLLPKVALGMVARDRHHVQRRLPNLRQPAGEAEREDDGVHVETAKRSNSSQSNCFTGQLGTGASRRTGSQNAPISLYI